MIILSLLFFKDTTFRSFIGNIGYGVFCSTFVALLIDFGATKRQSERDERLASAYTISLKNSIFPLIELRAKVAPDYIDDLSKLNASDKLSYSFWITKLIENNTGSNETINRILDLFFKAVDGILERAKDLRYKSSILFNNSYLTEDFLNNLDELIHALEVICNYRESNDNLYEPIANAFTLLGLMFPEYEGVFTEEWNPVKMRKYL